MENIIMDTLKKIFLKDRDSYFGMKKNIFLEDFILAKSCRAGFKAK